MGRGEADCSGKMKQFATYFTHGIRGGAKLRTAIYHAREAAWEIQGLVDEFFAAPEGDVPAADGEEAAAMEEVCA